MTRRWTDKRATTRVAPTYRLLQEVDGRDKRGHDEALMRRELRRRRGGRALHLGEAVAHRLLHLLEGAHLDLPHALARDAELLGELLERDGVIRQPARLKDAALAVVE